MKKFFRSLTVKKYIAISLVILLVSSSIPVIRFLGDDYSSYAESNLSFKAQFEYLQRKLENTAATLLDSQTEKEFVLDKMHELYDRRQHYIKMREAYLRYIYDNAEQLQAFYEKWGAFQQEVDEYLLLFVDIVETLETELEYIDTALHLLYELNESVMPRVNSLIDIHQELQEKIYDLSYIWDGDLPAETAPSVPKDSDCEYEDCDCQDYDDYNDYNDNKNDYSYDSNENECIYDSNNENGDSHGHTYNDGENDYDSNDEEYINGYPDTVTEMSAGSVTLWGSVASIFAPLSVSASSAIPDEIDVFISDASKYPPMHNSLYQLESLELELLQISMQLEAYFENLKTVNYLTSRFKSLRTSIEDSLSTIATWQNLNWNDFGSQKLLPAPVVPLFEIVYRIYSVQTEIKALLSYYLEQKEAEYLAGALFSMHNYAEEASFGEAGSATMRTPDLPSHLYTQLNDILQNHDPHVFTLALEILPQVEQNIAYVADTIDQEECRGFFIDLQAPAQYMTYLAGTVEATNVQVYNATELSDCTVRIFLSDIPSYGTTISVQAVLEPHPPSIISTIVYLYEYQNPDYILRRVIDIAPAYMSIAPMMAQAQQTWREGWPTVDGVDWTPPAVSTTTFGVMTAASRAGTAVQSHSSWLSLGNPLTGPLHGIGDGFPPAGWPGVAFMGIGITAPYLVINITSDMSINAGHVASNIGVTAHIPRGKTVILRGRNSSNTDDQVRTITMDTLFESNHFHVHRGATLILDNIILCGGTGFDVSTIINTGGRSGGVIVEGQGLGIEWLPGDGPPGRLYVGRRSEIRNSRSGQGGGVELRPGGPFDVNVLNAAGGWLTTHSTSRIYSNNARDRGGSVWGGNGSIMRLAGTIDYSAAGGGVFPWLPGIILPASDNSQGGGVWGGVGSSIDIYHTARIDSNSANFGGGVYIEGAQALGGGGGIVDMWSPGSRLRMFGGNISNNIGLAPNVVGWELFTADTIIGMGGGIYATGRTDVILYEGYIENNVAQGFDVGGGLDLGRPQRGFGGGIFMGDRSVLEMHGGTIRGNTAVYGGGVMLQAREVLLDSIDALTPGVRFDMYGGYIEGNFAVPHRGVVINRGGEGGGVRVDRTATFNMYGGTIRNNNATGRPIGGGFSGMPGSANGTSATSGGGVSVGFNIYMYGLLIQRAGIMNMFGGNIENNSAIFGGGISICGGRAGVAIFPMPGRLFMHGGTIHNNTASRDGGGIWVRRDSRAYLGDHTTHFNHSEPPVIHDNTAGSFGGGTWHAFRSHLNIGGVGISITNNHAGQDGGGMFISTTTYGDPLPNGAYNIGTTNVRQNIHFNDNTAGNGWFITAINAGTFGGTRIPYMAGDSNSLLDFGIRHSLNNYDINYRGVRPFWFVKHNDAGNPLPGAVFRMERYAGDGNWAPIRTLPSRPGNTGPLQGEYHATSLANGNVGTWFLTHDGIYRLIEVEATNDFFTPVGHWTVVWVGGPPLPNSPLTTIVNGQFVVTPHGGNPAFQRGPNRTYSVPNKREALPFTFSFYKRGTDSQPLPNAGFHLYRKYENASCNNCEDSNCNYWIVVTQSVRSGQDGNVDLLITPIGFYRLYEYYAPTVGGVNYRAPSGYWFIYWCVNTQSLVTRGQTPSFSRVYVPCNAEDNCACNPIWLCHYCYLCNVCRRHDSDEDDECIRHDHCDCYLGVCIADCIIRCADCDHPDCHVIVPCNNHYIYILYNYPGIPLLHLYKTDYDDHTARLQYAEFRLYRRCATNLDCECAYEYGHECECDYMCECECDCYECDLPWHYVKTVASNDDGQIRLDLSDSQYRLIETEAPDGFETPNGYWLIDWCTTTNRFVIAEDAYFNPQVIREYYYCESCPEPGNCSNCSYRILIPNRPLSTVYFEFHKATHEVNLLLWNQSGWVESVLLPGAHFSLFRYNGPGSPPNDSIIAESMIGDGPDQWTLADTEISSGLIGDPIRFELTTRGYYQLVETIVPDGWQRPNGQWRVTVTETPEDSGNFTFNIEGIGSPPAFVTRPHYCESEEYCECVIHFLGNRPVFDLPMSGSLGSHPFHVAGLLLLFVTLGVGTYVIVKKQNERAFKA